MSERSFRRANQRRVEATKRRESRRAKKAAAAAAAAGAFVLTSPAVSSAATYVVNQTSDGVIGTTTCDPTDTTVPCNLRDAIAQAGGNTVADDITFDSTITGDTDPANRTITLNSGRLIVNDNYPLNVYGGPTPDSIYIDGNYTSMVFDVQNTYNGSGATGLTLSGLTIQYGTDDPAGGIYAEQGSDVLLTNSTVTGNTAFGAQVDKYAFAGGGGISNRGTMQVQNSLISGNEADTYAPSHYPYLPYGGGGGIDNLGDLTVTGSTVDNNYSRYLGGGIFTGLSKYPSSMHVSNTTISSNYADDGGGVATIDLLGAAAHGNSTNQIVDSTISGNHASDGGGFSGKYIGPSQRWTISHSTVSGNNAYDDGGGLYFERLAGTFNLLDSTISGNYAENYGGGAYIESQAQKYEDALQFNNSTIASNQAYEDGGGIYLDYANTGSTYFPIPLFSTIVGDNTNSGGLNDLAQASDFSSSGAGAFELSFSLVRAPGNAVLTENPPGSNIIGADPLLGVLGNNGGPTETQLPSINSPVVDKGSAPGNLTTDQRGNPRTVDTSPANANDGTDIGSVELPTGPPGPPGPAAQTPQAQVKVGTLKKKHKKRRRVIRTKHKFAKVRLTFRSNVPGAIFRCSVDGGLFEPCESPFVTKLASAPGKGKKHKIAIQQVDAAGNPIGKVRVFKFRVVLKD